MSLPSFPALCGLPTGPARAALKDAGVVALAQEAAKAGTHVAGSTEGSSEAAMGQQTTEFRISIRVRNLRRNVYEFTCKKLPIPPVNSQVSLSIWTPL